jgi:hypothetical protein
MKKIESAILIGLFFLLLESCQAKPQVENSAPQILQYSFSTAPWLGNLFACAGKTAIKADQRALDYQDIQIADFVFRMGQVVESNAHAFQIGKDDLIIIANPANKMKDLTLEQVRGLFGGQIHSWKSINGVDNPVQVWVFPAGEDIQRIFSQVVMNGSPITSLARLATSADEMNEGIGSDVNAIGIITSRLKSESVAQIYLAIKELPVLIITKTTPDEMNSQIILCLQQ